MLLFPGKYDAQSREHLINPLKISLIPEIDSHPAGSRMKADMSIFPRHFLRRRELLPFRLSQI